MHKTYTICWQEAAHIIASGGCVIDIGQVSPRTRAVLREYVKKGVYERFDYFGFPQPKAGYCLAGRGAVCKGFAPNL